jgi:phosphoribosylanthranilate isomerase
MRNQENIQEVLSLKPDFMGFIFYDHSPRSVRIGDNINKIFFPPTTKKVGVFVNESEEIIMQKVKTYELSAVQLHGEESPCLCQKLKDNALLVFKAISVAKVDDMEQTAAYVDQVDYFVFDTKTTSFGGSGKKFDWRLLQAYKGSKPFLLSGGIDRHDSIAIASLNHPLFVGVDLNSRFEKSPGIKDVELLKAFIQDLNKHTNESNTAIV